MKIIVAPDSFKGSLSASQVAVSIKNGILSVKKDAEVCMVPMADGGEGTMEALCKSTKGKIIKINVKDPLFRDIESEYALIDKDKTAVVELAKASGLTLLRKEEYNPLITTTYGTGEMINDALKRGCNKIIICIGGSSTNDGGAGIAQALGAKLTDKYGHEIGHGGGELEKISKIDIGAIKEKIKGCSFLVACDVTNTLCGESGASYVYGPQKGATLEMVKGLDNNLYIYGTTINKIFDLDIFKLSGGGAAGGTGAGLFAFLNAKLLRGIDIVIEAAKLEEKIKGADLVITGEGKIDAQTLNGKTAFGVAKVAKKYGVPVIAIGGSIGEGAEALYDHGFKALYSVMDKDMSLSYAMKNASMLIEDVTKKVIIGNM